MKLLTKNLIKQFEKTGDLSQTPIEEINVLCKWFNPCGPHTWYVYERLDDDRFMAFVTLGDPDCSECGTISLSEIQSLKLPYGLSIERDLGFQITPLEKVIQTVKQGGYI